MPSFHAAASSSSADLHRSANVPEPQSLYKIKNPNYKGKWKTPWIDNPESVVPEAYREWEVKVFDWQTQCATLAKPEDSIFSYKSIKLLPTVGCEADAATQYNIDERNIGGADDSASAFAYRSSGCYAAVWLMEDIQLMLKLSCMQQFVCIVMQQMCYKNY